MHDASMALLAAEPSRKILLLLSMIKTVTTMVITFTETVAGIIRHAFVGCRVTHTKICVPTFYAAKKGPFACSKIRAPHRIMRFVRAKLAALCLGRTRTRFDRARRRSRASGGVRRR